jgi:hypothetical protein
MTDTIRAAAHALAGARQKVTSVAYALAEAQSVADELQARVTALETERAGIIAAARAGDHDPKHALRLGVINADLQDLAPMTADASAGVTAAAATDQEARQAVVRAEQQMGMAEAAELEQRLAEHAGKLEALLMATLTELTAAGKRVGRARPIFSPNSDLVDQLTKLRFTAAGIRR